MNGDLPLRQFLLLKLALAVAVDLNICLWGPCFNHTVFERILQRYDQQSCKGSHSQVNILMLPAKHFFNILSEQGVTGFPFILAMKSMQLQQACEYYVLEIRPPQDYRATENVYSPFRVLLLYLEISAFKGHPRAPLPVQRGRLLLAKHSSWGWSMLLTVSAKPGWEINHYRIEK